MTDNEIIKALECCSMGSYPACRDCPYHDNYVNRGCINKRNADIKDLINRQKAEIERLKTQFRDLDIECTRLEKENEGLNTEVALLHTDYTYKFVKAKAKSEARKEFAERLTEEWLAVVLLKNKSDDYAEGYHDALCFVEERIDNLLKELEGDSDGMSKLS